MEPLSLTCHKAALIGIVGDMTAPDGIEKVVVTTGGTSDISGAKKAALTAEFLGSKVTKAL